MAEIVTVVCVARSCLVSTSCHRAALLCFSHAHLRRHHLPVGCFGRSDGGLGEVALGGMEKSVRELMGIDTQIFSRAPPEAMAQTLDYVRRKYGGLREYMEHIGFPRAAQEALHRSLLRGS
jgi:Tyrosine phosphatase family